MTASYSETPVAEEQRPNARINWAISCREWLRSCILSRHGYSETRVAEEQQANVGQLFTSWR